MSGRGREKERTKYMANVDEKAFIKKTKHTNKRAGFDVNQANYLGDNLKKKNEVAPALARSYVHLCQIFKWHTITTPTHIRCVYLSSTYASQKCKRNLYYIHSLALTLGSQKFSLNFDFGSPFIEIPFHFVNKKYTHALAFSQ